MTNEQLGSLKSCIREEVSKVRSKDFRFWGGIILMMSIVILWGSLVAFNQRVEENERQIDPKSYSWDHAYDLFKNKYQYEKDMFALVENENTILKSCIDDLYYFLFKDDLYLTYQQKAEIILRDMERRGFERADEFSGKEQQSGGYAVY
jgi:hypothetical protein